MPTHLLILVPPTTNGRLHLGHLAGPLLRMDVLARQLRRRGDRAVLVGASDPHDSFVALAAETAGVAPAAVVDRWHGAIEADLRAVAIEPDRYLDLLTGPTGDRYRQLCHQVMAALVATGRTRTVAEPIPYSTSTGRPVLGGWLLARCPDCGTATAGLLCEGCGGHFAPAELVEPRGRGEAGPLEWRQTESVFLELPQDGKRLLDLLPGLGVTADFADRVAARLRTAGALVRLTQPLDWGVDWPGPGVVFSYTAGVLAYWLLCGETHTQLTGQPVFTSDSAVTTWAGFGLDNAMPFLLGGVGPALELPGARPLDRVLLNHFLDLEGSKFSTSRGHAVWVRELAAEYGADPVRAYLTLVDPGAAPADFSRAAFGRFVAETLRGRWSAAVRSAAEQLTDSAAAAAPEPVADALLERLLAEQDRTLDPSGYWAHRLTVLLDPVERWIERRPQVPPGWWLRGLALLASPVLPEFGTALWRWSGAAGVPTLAGVRQAPTGPVAGTGRVPLPAAAPTP